LQVQYSNALTVNFPKYNLANLFTEKVEEFRPQKSPIAGDLDEYCTKLSDCLKSLMTRMQLTRSCTFAPIKMLRNPRTSTYNLATIFVKSLFRPASRIFEGSQFVICFNN